MSKEFEEYWKEQVGISMILGDIHKMCASKAWFTKQKEITQLQAELERERSVKVKLIDCVEHFAYACENEFAMSVLNGFSKKERK